VESSSRTLVCSVLFLDIVEYSKKPVAEQLELKQAFNRALATALEQVPQRDRIILDTGDGAAVTFMGDPEDALFAALAVRNMASDGMPVRLGVNLGPVRLVKDLNGQMNIIGDGINVAQRVMSFADPGQLLVSRSFYEVVSCLSRDYMNLFRHEGSRTDKHVREHEVYSVVGGAPMARRVAQTESMVQARDGGWLAGMGPLGLRRSALLAAARVLPGGGRRGRRQDHARILGAGAKDWRCRGR
jgi:class 3 adenylate cyclase